MAFDLEHFSLTLATGLLVCLGLIIIWNSLFRTRGFELLKDYEPKEAMFAVALALAFVVGFLAEDGFDSVAPDFLDQQEAKYWQPIDSDVFETISIPQTRFKGYERIERILIPASKEKIRFESLFGTDASEREKDPVPNLRWHVFARYYKDLRLFSKLIPQEPAYNALFDELVNAIEEGRRIKVKECSVYRDCRCYRIRDKCYPPISINRYINNFVNQTYYHSKNLVFANKNYFDELTDRERRVNFSRTITYVSLLFFISTLTIIAIEVLIWAIRKVFAPFNRNNEQSPSATKPYYLIVPTVSFFLLAFLARHAYEFEQDQLNKRVFGYTTSLGLLAEKSGRENAFERYFLGLGSEPGSAESGSKPSGM
jgi:hypothetical protein